MGHEGIADTTDPVRENCVGKSNTTSGFLIFYACKIGSHKVYVCLVNLSFRLGKEHSIFLHTVTV